MESSLYRLVEIMARLRGENGCPWDREQTLETLKVYLLEESFEVRQAIDSGDPEALREELGDLLLQVIFQSRIAEEKGWFGIEDVALGIAEKLIRRHPHLFGGSPLSTAGEVTRQWEELKDQERRRRAGGSRLASVPPGLPALLRALRLSERAARSGFDWDRTAQVFDKVREEIGEWEAEVASANPERAARELGDLLFSLVNVARHLGLDPEAALQSANDRFARRFGHLERALEGEGKDLKEAGAARLEELWQEAKRRTD
jgi:tetrapyrrole methylase family protein/MazG family protein